MKKIKFSMLILIPLFCLFSCASQKSQQKKGNPLKGTWKAIYDLPNGEVGVKSFTATHFNWYYATSNGHIMSVGAGTYKIMSDSHFVETVEAEGPYSSYIGNNAEINHVIKGDTLITKFRLVGQNFSEKWLRVK